jgi:hypothetical protein
MLDVMYDLPSTQNVKEVIISEDVVARTQPPILRRKRPPQCSPASLRAATKPRAQLPTLSSSSSDEPHPPVPVRARAVCVLRSFADAEGSR